MLPVMVESNHDEERLARAEQMIEALQRESAALQLVTAKIARSVAALSPLPLALKRTA
jgi:hypothetical protein